MCSIVHPSCRRQPAGGRTRRASTRVLPAARMLHSERAAAAHSHVPAVRSRPHVQLGHARPATNSPCRAMCPPTRPGPGRAARCTLAPCRPPGVPLRCPPAEHRYLRAAPGRPGPVPPAGPRTGSPLAPAPCARRIRRSGPWPQKGHATRPRSAGSQSRRGTLALAAPRCRASHDPRPGSDDAASRPGRLHRRRHRCSAHELASRWQARHPTLERPLGLTRRLRVTGATCTHAQNCVRLPRHAPRGGRTG